MLCESGRIEAVLDVDMTEIEHDRNLRRKFAHYFVHTRGSPGLDGQLTLSISTHNLSGLQG